MEEIIDIYFRIVGGDDSGGTRAERWKGRPSMEDLGRSESCRLRKVPMLDLGCL